MATDCGGHRSRSPDQDHQASGPANRSRPWRSAQLRLATGPADGGSLAISFWTRRG